jgi:hypothetical protein
MIPDDEQLVKSDIDNLFIKTDHISFNFSSKAALQIKINVT